MEILLILIGIAMGAVVGFFLAMGKSGGKVAALNAELDAQKVRMDEQVRSYESRIAELKEQYEKQEEKTVQQYKDQLEGQRKQYDQQLAELKQQQMDQMAQQMALIKAEMNTASEKILAERSVQLGEKNKEQLSAILNPLKDGIRQMQEAVEKSDREHTNTMQRLDATIRTSIDMSNKVGERADKLAQALTAENKTQGNFGELQLKQMLQSMQLTEGLQFEEQVTMKDAAGRTITDEESGHRMVPDVILHFPDKRDVVIDSKVSLKAFEEYHSADSDELRQDALKRHVASLKKHVDELARKDYAAYLKNDVEKPDFVLMYVPFESALQLALAGEAGLWTYAYEKGVIISGSQNLYMILRVLEMTWRQALQAENQEKIMKAANMVVDRVQLFYERFLKVEDLLEKTQTAFDDVKKVTASTGQSIEVAARSLVKFGAKENIKRKYKLPKTDDEQLLLDIEGD